MGPVKTFDIIFSNPAGYFTSGQNVSGTIKIELNESMKLRGTARFISCFLKRAVCSGESTLSWRSGGVVRGREQSVEAAFRLDATARPELHRIRHPYALFLSGSEPKHLLLETPVSITGADAPVLNVGAHEFPFAFALPSSSPSSFESKVGHIRYTIKAYLHRCVRAPSRATLTLSSLDRGSSTSRRRRPSPVSARWT